MGIDQNQSMKKAGSTSNLNGSGDVKLPPGPSTTQTWPFVEVYCNKRYFYLEAQSYIIDGHAELFLWLWFLGTSTYKQTKTNQIQNQTIAEPCIHRFS